MIFLPTQSNGRLIAGDTPWGAFNIEVQRSPTIDPGIRRIALVENGVQVGTMTIEIRTPAGAGTAPAPTADAGCSACQQGKGTPPTTNDLTAWNQAMQEGTTL